MPMSVSVTVADHGFLEMPSAVTMPTVLESVSYSSMVPASITMSNKITMSSVVMRLDQSSMIASMVSPIDVSMAMSLRNS